MGDRGLHREKSLVEALDECGERLDRAAANLSNMNANSTGSSLGLLPGGMDTSFSGRLDSTGSSLGLLSGGMDTSFYGRSDTTGSSLGVLPEWMDNSFSMGPESDAESSLGILSNLEASLDQASDSLNAGDNPMSVISNLDMNLSNVLACLPRSSPAPSPRSRSPSPSSPYSQYIVPSPHYTPTSPQHFPQFTGVEERVGTPGSAARSTPTGRATSVASPWPVAQSTPTDGRAPLAQSSPVAPSLRSAMRPADRRVIAALVGRRVSFIAGLPDSPRLEGPATPGSRRESLAGSSIGAGQLSWCDVGTSFNTSFPRSPTRESPRQEPDPEHSWGWDSRFSAYSTGPHGDTTKGSNTEGDTFGSTTSLIFDTEFVSSTEEHDPAEVEDFLYVPPRQPTPPMVVPALQPAVRLPTPPTSPENLNVNIQRSPQTKRYGTMQKELDELKMFFEGEGQSYIMKLAEEHTRVIEAEARAKASAKARREARERREEELYQKHLEEQEMMKREAERRAEAEREAIQRRAMEEEQRRQREREQREMAANRPQPTGYNRICPQRPAPADYEATQLRTMERREGSGVRPKEVPTRKPKPKKRQPKPKHKPSLSPRSQILKLLASPKTPAADKEYLRSQLSPSDVQQFDRELSYLYSEVSSGRIRTPKRTTQPTPTRITETPLQRYYRVAADPNTTEEMRQHLRETSGISITQGMERQARQLYTGDDAEWADLSGEAPVSPPPVLPTPPPVASTSSVTVQVDDTESNTSSRKRIRFNEKVETRIIPAREEGALTYAQERENAMLARFGTACPDRIPRTASTYRPGQSPPSPPPQPTYRRPQAPTEPMYGPFLPWTYGSFRPPPQTAAGRIPTEGPPPAPRPRSVPGRSAPPARPGQGRTVSAPARPRPTSIPRARAATPTAARTQTTPLSAPRTLTARVATPRTQAAPSTRIPQMATSRTQMAPPTRIPQMATPRTQMAPPTRIPQMATPRNQMAPPSRIPQIATPRTQMAPPTRIAQVATPRTVTTTPPPPRSQEATAYSPPPPVAFLPRGPRPLRSDPDAEVDPIRAGNMSSPVAEIERRVVEADNRIRRIENEVFGPIEMEDPFPELSNVSPEIKAKFADSIDKVRQGLARLQDVVDRKLGERSFTGGRGNWQKNIGHYSA